MSTPIQDLAELHAIGTDDCTGFCTDGSPCVPCAARLEYGRTIEAISDALRRVKNSQGWLNYESLRSLKTMQSSLAEHFGPTRDAMGDDVE